MDRVSGRTCRTVPAPVDCLQAMPVGGRNVRSRRARGVDHGEGPATWLPAPVSAPGADAGNRPACSSDGRAAAGGRATLPASGRRVATVAVRGGRSSIECGFGNGKPRGGRNRHGRTGRRRLIGVAQLVRVR